MTLMCEKQTENTAVLLLYTLDSQGQIQGNELVIPLCGAICHITRLKF